MFVSKLDVLCISNSPCLTFSSLSLTQAV